MEATLLEIHRLGSVCKYLARECYYHQVNFNELYISQTYFKHKAYLQTPYYSIYLVCQLNKLKSLSQVS